MANQWFRFYAEVLNDPKVQTLPGDVFKMWVNILCIASNNDGNLPKIEDLAFALRMPLEVTERGVYSLVERGLVEIVGVTEVKRYSNVTDPLHVTLQETDETQSVTFRIRSWNKRQYKADSSADRVKRYRQAKRNGSVTEVKRYSNVTDPLHVTGETQSVTLPDTEADTETEKSKQDNKTDSVEGGKGVRSRGVRMLPDFQMPESWLDWAGGYSEAYSKDDLARIFEEFRDHWVSKSGADAVKRDWFATWRNWIRRQEDFKPRARHGKPTNLHSGFAKQDYYAGTETFSRVIGGDEPGDAGS